MGSRLELQYLLEELLGNENVYYNPPATLMRRYPSIEYTRDDINTIHASNNTYLMTNQYKITVIDTLPDNSVITKLLKLPMCVYDRHYTSDGLYHDVLQLYY